MKINAFALLLITSAACDENCSNQPNSNKTETENIDKSNKPVKPIVDRVNVILYNKQDIIDGLKTLYRDIEKNITDLENATNDKEKEEILKNILTSKDLNPLVYAASNNKLEVVKFLISAGADVNAANSVENSSLYFAVRDKNLEMVKFLISEGADVNKKNDNNEAALHIAVKDINSLEIVNALLDANADVNIKDRYKVTPLHTAIDTAAVNKNNPNGAAMIKALIENNANIDAINNLKETPLKKAISYNYLHGINDLLNAGADVNKKDDNGNTPLHIAVDTGKLDTIKALLEHNPDKTIENNYHKTPLDTVKERKKHANAENSKVFQDIIDVLENYEYKK